MYFQGSLQHERFPASREAVFCNLSRGTGEKLVLLKDMSRNGLSIELDEEIFPGDAVELRLYQETLLGEVVHVETLLGEVVHVETLLGEVVHVRQESEKCVARVKLKYRLDEVYLGEIRERWCAAFL